MNTTIENTVIDKLIDMGISADRLTSKGFGESVPISDNSSAEGKAAVANLMAMLGYTDAAFGNTFNFHGYLADEDSDGRYPRFRLASPEDRYNGCQLQASQPHAVSSDEQEERACQTEVSQKGEEREEEESSLHQEKGKG